MLTPPPTTPLVVIIYRSLFKIETRNFCKIKIGTEFLLGQMETVHIYERSLEMSLVQFQD